MKNQAGAKLRALAISMTVFMVGCATPYGSSGLTGGYSDERIDDSNYRVKFRGNGYASADRVWAFWIYRCAELTLQKGYTHFSIRKPGEPVAGWYQEDPAAPGGLRRVAASEGLAGAQMMNTKGGGAPTFIYVPGYTITTYSSDAIVAMYREPLPESVLVFSAKVVLGEIDPYVKANGETALIQRSELFNKAATMVQPQLGYSFGGRL